ncbi:MAG: SAM-dependent methyltransferase [uncultured bacterium]|nr:MAG: SAM-dependent methyltransferase [uncultured bacterium]OFW68151.1 MAG: methyltransferase type 11 [Alphaproteobacteria bacterium GWC2_42_16]OFW73544.1 MAG: methyltransferase type 11 [Alphaproteobacteria bacterium GWA2_41_27]OFW82393.1 MAG: methyltransferase type 11 [Alphaproteobacteria bacterium RIFCSPHIGHO2_12_FULL_42_100]OFW91777.1 MAG: methyltransferase type 11 [Alphaproteobacteria bacterium RIFCSPHIGHO2_02_FULL_42_30]OFW92947.1 MAG: methyltransferase type 11 [Alphaproteobacteria bact
MWPDVLDMRNFYDTHLGYVTRRMIRRKIRELWPEVKGRNMIALGYPTPFLRYYREESRRLVALMPAEQGALSWTRKTPNIVVLTEETSLPLPNKCADFALLVHALEFTSYPTAMIQEIWRVLVDGGRLIIVVPNRTGIWARTEKTPFGQGHPYSLFQLHQFLKENTFSPIHSEHALYIPPFRSHIPLSTATAWEKIGHRWFKTLSGVLIVEAIKQVYAGAAVQELSWKAKLQVSKKLILPFK